MSAEDSRRAILEAATIELSERGLAGVRMEHVAARAKLNKALVYRYFTSKEELFVEVLRAKFTARYDVAQRAPDDLREALVYWFRHAARDPHFLRLQLGEVLSDQGGELAHEALRRAYFEAQIADIDARKKRRQLPADVESPEMLLALIALVSFPAFFPTMTRLVTGHTPDSPAFKARWAKSLERIADLLGAPEPRRPTTKTKTPAKRKPRPSHHSKAPTSTTPSERSSRSRPPTE